MIESSAGYPIEFVKTFLVSFKDLRVEAMYLTVNSLKLQKFPC